MESVNSETERQSSDDSSSSGNSQSQRRVGILYDERMCKHSTPDGDHHPENPNRIRAIWNKLQIARIPQRCVVLNAKEAEDRFILNVHAKKHVDLIKNISSKEFDSRRNKIAAKFNSIYFNEGSTESAYLAAGSVVDVTERVAKGELNSAFAIVRPPGHHAEHNEAMGFCLHNNVAIATSFLLNERPELGIKKILIVDWDVHHGNGTQKMFWKDSRVLFFSVHRHEFGTFYPANDDGFYTMIGEGPGAGYNINVPWENGCCGDADYLAVWDHILIPVAKEFNPDIIIISAGFDAAVGDPLGGCRVTPYGYSVMLKKLMNFSQGKIVLALEGGYNLDSIANSALACMQVLLENMPINGSSEAYPFESTWRVIQAVRQELKVFWPTLADELPTTLISQTAQVPPKTVQRFPSSSGMWKLLVTLDTLPWYCKGPEPTDTARCYDTLTHKQMEDDKIALIRKNATERAKKRQEEGVPPIGGTSPVKPYIKRKGTDKVDRPTKKPKVPTTVGETPPAIQLPTPPYHGMGKGLITAKGPVMEQRAPLLREDSQYAIGRLLSIINDDDYEDLGNHTTKAMGESGLFSMAKGVLMIKGLMDRCLAQEKLVDRLKERAEAVETELNELKAWGAVHVRKLDMTKKALEELERHVEVLKNVLHDKEGEISMLREQVRRAKEDGKIEFRNSDSFLKELGGCYYDGFQECLRQVKVLYPDLDVSQNLLFLSSDSEVEDDNGAQASEDLEEVLQGIIQPLSNLKVNEDHQGKEETEDKNNNAYSPWRSELSKIDVWYASFGSNMWKPRFLCYVKGGQVEGMQGPCRGSLDKTPPKEILWGTYPHHLFFGRESTSSWGPGGVAFLNPERKIQDKAYLCLYRITLEQFNDILCQENNSSYCMTSPLFDLDDLISVASNESNSLELQMRGWYSNVVYLGKEEDIPILTMTCVNSDMESFRSGKLPIVAPCKAYMNTLVRGLVEGGQLSEEEAMAYIQEATKKPL